MTDEALTPELERARHWRYFLIIENDLETALRYVEPAPANFPTFSLEFARLLLAACAQLEIIARLVCNRRRPNSERPGMRRIIAALLEAYPGLPAWAT